MPKTRGLTRSQRLENRVEDIFDGWLGRSQAEKVLPPYDSANGYLKRAVYELVNDPAIAEDDYRRLKDIVEKRCSVTASTPPITENPYFWAFLLVFSESKDLSRTDRSKFSSQLLYAAKNDVPAHLLVGFLYQIGGHSRVVEQLATGEVEEWALSGKLEGTE